MRQNSFSDQFHELVQVFLYLFVLKLCPILPSVSVFNQNYVGLLWTTPQPLSHDSWCCHRVLTQLSQEPSRLVAHPYSPYQIGTQVRELHLSFALDFRRLYHVSVGIWKFLWFSVEKVPKIYVNFLPVGRTLCAPFVNIFSLFFPFPSLSRYSRFMFYVIFVCRGWMVAYSATYTLEFSSDVSEAGGWIY